MFNNKNDIAEAKIFFGSTEAIKEQMSERKSPYDGSVVSISPVCDTDDTIKALKIAKVAIKAMATSPLSQRIAWLEDVAIQLNKEKESFALMLAKEVAKPIAFARIEVERCAETIKLTAMEVANLCGETIPTDIMPSGKRTMAYYRREPVGVVVCITPFNFPLNLIAHKIAPALGAGNTVVLKPTPEAPMTAYMLAKLFINSKYAVKDALSVVYGDAEVGSTLVKSPIPRVISFTGSVPVGKIIMSQAGIKKVSLELGGNAATYIDKSADLELAAKRCAYGAFYNSGQVCISLQRIYVHEEVYEIFSELMAKETKTLKVGSPYDEDTFMGPLIDEESKHRAKTWVASAKNEGAYAVAGDNEVDGIFTPTVMTNVTDDMKIICEEVFAPIVSLVSVPSYTAAVEKMNNSPYGLQFSIFTNNLKMTQHFIDDTQCGGVVINDIPTLRFDVQPYGGAKLSGVGREGPKWALEEFTEIKSIVIC
ncbi:MAG: aldehyde dehydrogenase family protein [Sulfurovum sp.]|nr:aldehyde dehydrogenase family protein [Sulfurovum sp.]MCB4751871.1 aldehyde dehydrogenase family protein [Sulfurovum sp.]MCB4754829.1 aldehyde dehydrogenase family protein [Sulfurovum sp.]MCB4772764.1 aldehyde dehydrogenase family protein [Sulfurovum sp.]MCB4783255.1 aldehyde dehydrogenase family protein [Sulfurovum sp.]